jgi:hypothetical protein
MTKDEVLKNLEIARKYQGLTTPTFTNLLKKLEEGQVKVVATLNTGRVVDLDLTGFVEYYLDDGIDSFDVVDLPRYRPLTPAETCDYLGVYIQNHEIGGYICRIELNTISIRNSTSQFSLFKTLTYKDLMSYRDTCGAFLRKQI